MLKQALDQLSYFKNKGIDITIEDYVVKDTSTKNSFLSQATFLITTNNGIKASDIEELSELKVIVYSDIQAAPLRNLIARLEDTELTILKKKNILDLIKDSLK